MAQAKHSPAPWKNGRDANGEVVICQADYSTGPDRNEEYQANRALFDAAPDLLIALKAIASSPTAGEYESEYDGRVYILCSGCNFQDDVRPQHAEDCVFVQARAAITKATTTNGDQS